MIWNLGQRARLSQKQDLMGLDFGASGLKAVRIRRIRNQFHLVATGLFPPVDLSGNNGRPQLPDFPDGLLGSYAAVCLNDRRSALRILTLTGSGSPEDQIRAQLGVTAETRSVHIPLSAKPPRWLAASMPQSVVDTLLDLFRTGAPAVCDLELSGMATLTACLHALGEAAGAEPLCVMEIGAQSTFVCFLHEGRLVLVRKYETGADPLLNLVESELGVDRETALGVLREGAIDLSHAFREVLEPAIRQMVISRDFVERQEKCRIGRIHCSGALSASLFFRQVLRDTSGMEVEPWNPFQGLTVEPHAVPPDLAGSETRFAGAVGAALGVMTAPDD